MSFSLMVSEGLEKIYSEDLNAQRHYINTICRDVRHMRPDILYDMKCFFVPNNEYMIRYFGDEIVRPEYDAYDWEGRCIWAGKLIIPVYNLANQPVAFIGFNPIAKLTGWDLPEGEIPEPTYTYSKKVVFERGKYLFTVPGGYEKSIKDGYIILIDGVFDMLSLVQEGFNAGALLGSDITEYVVSQLKFVKHKFLAYDNDEAGIKLYHNLKRQIPDLLYIKQGIAKDMDDYLKVKDKYILRKSIDEILNNKIKTSINLDLF